MARTPLLVLAAVLVVSGAAMTGALTRTSSTFDELVLVSAGARGVALDDWALLVDQPPLLGWLYGLPLRAVGMLHPPDAAGPWEYDDRWSYGRAFYFQVGNDPRRVALLSRLVAVAMALALVVAVWAFTRSAEGGSGGRAGRGGPVAGGPVPGLRAGHHRGGPAEGAALLAAGLVAFLPDVLAHGGVAYNDLPAALFIFLAVWALDRVVQAPAPVSASVAGGAVALALGVKFSAVALAPVAALLLAAEAVRRGRDPGWWKDVGLAAAAAVAVAYAVTVLLYRGDLLLLGFRYGLWFTVLHASEGHPAPAYLLGETSATGWWYYFPVVFLLKTPAALHLLGLVALVGFGGWWWRRGTDLLGSPLRAPLVGLGVYGFFLLRSSLNIGLRHALPALPFLLVLTAVGVVRFWSRAGGRARLAVAILVLLYGGSALSAYPFFLGYTSEYVVDKDEAWRWLADSNLDWGQGLLELRRFQEEEGGAVRLSYFGSGLPAGYGIDYTPLPSFLALPPPEPGAGAAFPAPATPSWTAVSATNLLGLYFGEADPFAAYRDREPDRVLGGSILLFRESPGDGAP